MRLMSADTLYEFSKVKKLNYWVECSTCINKRHHCNFRTQWLWLTPIICCLNFTPSCSHCVSDPLCAAGQTRLVLHVHIKTLQVSVTDHTSIVTIADTWVGLETFCVTNYKENTCWVCHKVPVLDINCWSPTGCSVRYSHKMIITRNNIDLDIQLIIWGVGFQPSYLSQPNKDITTTANTTLILKKVERRG